jgi:hypothetical protein
MSRPGPRRRSAGSGACAKVLLLLALTPVGGALADSAVDAAAMVPSEAVLAERHLAARLDWRSYYLDRLDRQDRVDRNDVPRAMTSPPPADPGLPLGSVR